MFDPDISKKFHVWVGNTIIGITEAIEGAARMWDWAKACRLRLMDEQLRDALKDGRSEGL